MNTPKLSRREFIQTQGALIVGTSGAVFVGDALAQAAPPAVVGPQPTALDTWIRIATDGRVTANFGKMDCGQGLDTAIGQIVAEELPFKRNELDRLEALPRASEKAKVLVYVRRSTAD